MSEAAPIVALNFLFMNEHIFPFVVLIVRPTSYKLGQRPFSLIFVSFLLSRSGWLLQTQFWHSAWCGLPQRKTRLRFGPSLQIHSDRFCTCGHQGRLTSALLDASVQPL